MLPRKCYTVTGASKERAASNFKAQESDLAVKQKWKSLVTLLTHEQSCDLDNVGMVPLHVGKVRRGTRHD